MDCQISAYRCSVCSQTSPSKSVIVRHTESTTCILKHARPIPCFMTAKYKCDKNQADESGDIGGDKREIILKELYGHQKLSILNGMSEVIGIEPRFPLSLYRVRSVSILSLIEDDSSIFDDVKKYEDFFVSFFRLNGGDKGTDKLQFIWRLQDLDIFLIHLPDKVILRGMDEIKETILNQTQNTIEKFIIVSQNVRNNHAYIPYREKFSDMLGSPCMMFDLMNKESCISRILEHIPVITL